MFDRLARNVLPGLMLAAALVVWSAPGAAQPPTNVSDSGAVLTNAEILTALDIAACGPADRTDPHLYRWPAGKAITVRTIGSSPASYRQWVTAHLAALSDLTGLDIETTDGIGAGVIIAFVPSFGDVLEGRYNDLLDRFVAPGDRRYDLLGGYRAARAVCAGAVRCSWQRPWRRPSCSFPPIPCRPWYMPALPHRCHAFSGCRSRCHRERHRPWQSPARSRI